MRDFRLYVILDVDICQSYGDVLEMARKIVFAGAEILQLRTKTSSDRQILKIARGLKNLIQKNKALFILNNRPDLARIVDADGVHLGQQDLPAQDARNILGNGKIVGISTHSVEQACEAEKQGTDYIGLGPIFPTTTKPEAVALGPKIIAKVKDKIKIPFVAVGGIDLDNLDRVLSFGAQRVAVCRAIITAKDVSAVTKEFRRRLYR